MKYKITPVPKPRQTRSDKWKKRPCVLRYRDFADKCRDAGITIPEFGAHVIFHIPMPKSWSNKKKKENIYLPHKQRPDCDNLQKALLDAVFEEDCVVYDIRVTKIWDVEGAIEVRL